MEASLDLGACRPDLQGRIRVMLALAPLVVALAGCCHTPAEMVAPPVEEPRLMATPQAGLATQNVIARLGAANDPNKIADRLTGALPKEGFAAEFAKSMQCRQLGCFAEFSAPDAKRVLEISQLVAGQGSQFSAWSGWRYVSSWYVRENNGPKLITVAILDGHPTVKR